MRLQYRFWRHQWAFKPIPEHQLTNPTSVHTPTMKTNQVKLFSWNCNGFYHLVADLKRFISDLQPSIVGMQETHLQPTQIPKLPNYKIFNHLQVPTVNSKGRILLTVAKTIQCRWNCITIIHTNSSNPHFSTFTCNSQQHLSTSHRENWQEAINRSATSSRPNHTTSKLQCSQPSIGLPTDRLSRKQPWRLHQRT